MKRQPSEQLLRREEEAARAVYGRSHDAALLALLVWSCPASAAEVSGAAQFRTDIQPILSEFCYDCHADGANKGGVAFDEFKSDQVLLEDRELWWKALKNLRAELMPPPKKPQPTARQKKQIEEWIKTAVFETDPKNPDPGRVTVRRLNRVEYRNTIRDLMGIDFDTEKEFPPDDSGHGFDNIGDALTLPPMLLEKYLAAAKAVVTKAVPAVPSVPAEHVIAGRTFQRFNVAPGVPPALEGGILPPGTNVSIAGSSGLTSTNLPAAASNGMPAATGSALTLPYYDRVSASNTFNAQHAGRYQLLLDFAANERYVDNQFDYNKCRLVFKADGQELHSREYTREGGKVFHYEFDQDWKAGNHELFLEVHPLTPDQRQVRSLTLRIDSVTVRGPLDSKYWVRPKNYQRFFTRDTPKDAPARREYAREILEPFLRKAYRRPVDAKTVDRLVSLAESTYTQSGKTFEAGVGQAMVAVLASPRFLFREEGIEPATGVSTVHASSHALVDEYALASRLSYFFWSSMPDPELFRLAEERSLRKHLPAQIERMLADARSEALMKNFTGQWLQARDIETVTIDARQVLARESPADPDMDRRRQRFRELRDKPEENLTADEKDELAKLRGTLFRGFGRPLRAELTGDLRRAMRQETEKVFEHVVRKDRNLLELLDSDYTFLNERLARHYGLTNLNVVGDEMRLVKLPPDSPRGGILTQGTVLAVTSNPTRTSPVKRGLFVLDNILGTPPAPPPPDIPPLEDAAKDIKDRTPTLRETLAWHREKPLCSSCHNRMDPLGLGLENFNAMGMWRDQERSQPIDATGKLLSSESFTNPKELKAILANKHAVKFYRTLTEKLLTYALGRGLEYYDVTTVDRIVDRLEKTNGRPSELLAGIVESAPFQKTRSAPIVAASFLPALEPGIPPGGAGARASKAP
jgi:hypothetical protein